MVRRILLAAVVALIFFCCATFVRRLRAAPDSPLLYCTVVVQHSYEGLWGREGDVNVYRVPWQQVREPVDFSQRLRPPHLLSSCHDYSDLTTQWWWRKRFSYSDGCWYFTEIPHDDLWWMQDFDVQALSCHMWPYY